MLQHGIRLILLFAVLFLFPFTHDKLILSSVTPRIRNAMKLIPLGTSSGAPTDGRTVTGCALFIGTPKTWILIDCGEGTQGQITKAKLSTQDLGAICITHAHGDHCFGLFSLLAQLAINGRTKPLPLIAPPSVRTMTDCVLHESGTVLPYCIEWQEPSDTFTFTFPSGVELQALELNHRLLSFGYLFQSTQEKSKAQVAYLNELGIPSGPLMGQALNGTLTVSPNGSAIDPSLCFQYYLEQESCFIGGDNVDPMLIAQRASGAQVWVHEATYLHQDWLKNGAGQRWGHSSAQMIGQAAAQGRPDQLILTHFSSRYAHLGVTEELPNLAHLVQEAHSVCQLPVSAAQDLVPISVEPRIQLLAGPSKQKIQTRTIR